MEYPTYRTVCRAMESMAIELAALEEELRMANSPSVHDPAFLDTVAELIADQGADALRWGRDLQEPTRRGLQGLALQCMVTLAYYNEQRAEGLLTLDEAWTAEVLKLTALARDGLLEEGPYSGT